MKGRRIRVLSSDFKNQNASYLCCRSHHSPSAPNSNHHHHHHHHRSNHTPRRLAEAERLVPGLQELAAADPSAHTAFGGRSALAVRRGSEAEEVIRFVGFSFLFGFFSPFLLRWCVVWGFAI